MTDFKYDICVIGGGRVGLPLALAFALKDYSVAIFDKDSDRVELINKGKMPFLEKDADAGLEKVIGSKLTAFSDPAVINQSKFLIVVIGTPIDAHLNPGYNLFKRFLQENTGLFRSGQIMILRSTVYPGTTAKIKNYITKNKLDIDVAYCPERIAEGNALEELCSLSQIISGFTEHTLKEVGDLFLSLTSDIVVLDPIEAELAKLFTNSWRYIQFAVSNQFFMIAQNYGLDFHKIYDAMRHKYPRAESFPKPGFAAGPCLLKDTMQIAACNNNNFFLGHSAMLINEGLPNFILEQLRKKYDLSNMSAGILGMAFKAGSDDIRDSLSYKLKRLLEYDADEVYCSDEYVKDESFVTVEELLDKSDIIFIGAPHERYRELSTHKPIIDIWNLLGKGTNIS